MDEKIWYIKIDGQEEGPYSFKDLKRDKRITPDTLARRKNYPLWRPIRKIRELRKLFFDDESFDSEEGVSVLPRDELTLVMQRDPPYFFWWLLIAILLVAYIIYIYLNE